MQHQSVPIERVENLGPLLLWGQEVYRKLGEFPSQVAKRVWGQETLVVHTPYFTLKVLERRAGTIGPLQYHRAKDESTFLYSGHARLFHDPGTGKLSEAKVKAGAAYRFPPGSVHREDAVTDCVWIELSNPVFNDRVRMEEEYDISFPEPYGLKTSDPKELIVTDTWEKVRAFHFS